MAKGCHAVDVHLPFHGGILFEGVSTSKGHIVL